MCHNICAASALRKISYFILVRGGEITVCVLVAEVINMETYKNDYTREEDPMMWEIHEARHGLMQKIEEQGIEQFNQEAQDFYQNWKQQRQQRVTMKSVK
jgi:hypothetical protein